MKYFKHETVEDTLHLYPLVCWHLGAPQSDIGFIKKLVDRISNDPFARWVYMGDGGECSIKASKGDIYNQALNPTEQQNALVELMEPIKGLGLFGVKGNHGNRIYKETGLDFDETLCAKLGIPYMGVAAFWHLVLGKGSEHPGIYSIYTHHGADSGANIGTKVNKSLVFDRTFIADTILTAHSHVSVDVPPRYYATLGTPRKVSDPTIWKATHEYICGSAYDSRSGYAEEKGYSPLLPSHVMVEFEVDTNTGKKSQKCEIMRKENL